MLRERGNLWVILLSREHPPGHGNYPYSVFGPDTYYKIYCFNLIVGYNKFISF